MLGEFGFQVSDVLVEETVIVAGSLEPVLQLIVVLGELAGLLFERGVLGADLLERSPREGRVPGRGSVPLVVRRWCAGRRSRRERLLPPRRFHLCRLLGLVAHMLAACLDGGRSHECAGVGVLVEKAGSTEASRATNQVDRRDPLR